MDMYQLTLQFPLDLSSNASVGMYVQTCTLTTPMLYNLVTVMVIQQ